MKQDWHPDELLQYWTLSSDEHALLAHKTGSARLGFAVLLKEFQFRGGFPPKGDRLPLVIVAHLAQQVDVSAENYDHRSGNDRTLRSYQAEIRAHFGFRECSVEDGEELVAWLSERVISLDPESEN